MPSIFCGWISILVYIYIYRVVFCFLEREKKIMCERPLRKKETSRRKRNFVETEKETIFYERKRMFLRERASG